jgi:hypothetical protein
MRIRTIKPEFFKDEELATLEPLDRLLFIGLWCLADANGVGEYRPARIKAEVLPYDFSDVSQMLPRLSLGNWVRKFTVDGREYYAIRNWTKHQRISGKEAASGARYPLPPSDLWTGEATEKQPGNTREATGKHPGAQEQGMENGINLSLFAREGDVPLFDTRMPTAAEVETYAETLCYRIDGQAFLDHYGAAGWKHKGQPIADWRALVRTWKRREEERGYQAKIRPARRLSAADRLAEEGPSNG